MKKNRFLIILLMLFLPTIIFAKYEDERQDIYDYKEFFEDLFPTKHSKSSSCSTVGSVYAECSGVTVNGSTISLEEYIAGVVKQEFGGSASNDANRLELSKVNAIAARSFLMAQTGCTSVVNGESFQAYSPIDSNSHYDQIFVKAAEETAGIVMMRGDKIVTGYYTTVPVSKYITKSGGNWTFHMLHDANDSNSTFDYTMPEADIFRIASYTGVLYYPSEDSGHHWGIPSVGAAYEVEKGTSTEDILKIFYGSDISLAKLTSSGSTSSISTSSTSSKINSSSSSNFVCDSTDGGLNSADAKGFRKRTAQPESSNKHFFSNENPVYGTDNVGQCTWYAYGRASEILETAGSNLKMWGSFPNAGDWYSYNKSFGQNGFKSSTDVNSPKVGAIIVWTDNGTSAGCSGCGHVGVVEAVNSDGTVDISEANISGIKSPSNPYGWQYVSNMSISDIDYRWGGYSFIGYIYIVE